MSWKTLSDDLRRKQVAITVPHTTKPCNCLATMDRQLTSLISITRLGTSLAGLRAIGIGATLTMSQASLDFWKS
jgi:hypothetical protein